MAGHDRLPLHGCGKTLNKEDGNLGQRLLRALQQLGVLAEETFRQDNAYASISAVIKVRCRHTRAAARLPPPQRPRRRDSRTSESAVQRLALKRFRPKEGRDLVRRPLAASR